MLILDLRLLVNLISIKIILNIQLQYIKYNYYELVFINIDLRLLVNLIPKFTIINIIIIHNVNLTFNLINLVNLNKPNTKYLASIFLILLNVITKYKMLI